jgi:hypothetical protein
MIIIIPNTPMKMERIVSRSDMGHAEVNINTIVITSTKKNMMKVAIPMTPKSNVLGCWTWASSSGRVPMVSNCHKQTLQNHHKLCANFLNLTVIPQGIIYRYVCVHIFTNL